MEQGKIDHLNKEAVEILGYEKAPDNFTALVMNRLQRETVHAHGRDNPIIGKWGWLLIFMVFALLIAGLWYSSPAQNPGNGILADSLLNDWWTRYVQPFLSTIITSGSHFGLVVLIGLTATFLLFVDRLIGYKSKNRISFN